MCTKKEGLKLKSHLHNIHQVMSCETGSHSTLSTQMYKNAVRWPPDIKQIHEVVYEHTITSTFTLQELLGMWGNIHWREYDKASYLPKYDPCTSNGTASL